MFCMIKAFAKVVNLDEQEILKILGTDPTEIVDVNVKDATRYRGVYVEELVDVAAYLGITCYQVTAVPVMENGGLLWDEDVCDLRWNWYLQRFNGVILGSHPKAPSHAIAWIDGKPSDPTGLLSNDEMCNFVAEMFLALVKI